MTTATLIEAILRAPPDRHAAIVAAATGKGKAQPITAKEAAATLGVCKRTIHRWGACGVLTPVKIGPRLVRFDRREVERLTTAKAGG